MLSQRKRKPPTRAARSKRGLDTLQLPVGTILGTQDQGYKDGLNAQVDSGGLSADNIPFNHNNSIFEGNQMLDGLIEQGSTIPEVKECVCLEVETAKEDSLITETQSVSREQIAEVQRVIASAEKKDTAVQNKAIDKAIRLLYPYFP
jgi:hypothetical protein